MYDLSLCRNCHHSADVGGTVTPGDTEPYALCGDCTHHCNQRWKAGTVSPRHPQDRCPVYYDAETTPRFFMGPSPGGDSAEKHALGLCIMANIGIMESSYNHADKAHLLLLQKGKLIERLLDLEPVSHDTEINRMVCDECEASTDMDYHEDREHFPHTNDCSWHGWEDDIETI